MNTQLMPVPFHGDTIVLVGQDNEPYVAMKPVVTNMGLDWKSQHTKLGEKFGSVMVEITTTGGDGKQYDMTCLPLRKLAAWLYSISPNKVALELREKIIQYQEECDEVLWNYWTKGAAVRPGAVSIAQQISLSKHRLSLLKELHRTRDRSLRAAIHEQMAHVSVAMGLSVPPIDTIGAPAAEAPEILAPFWNALEQLDAQGIKYNHSKKPELLALNMTHLKTVFAAQGIELDIRADITLALKQSVAPMFLEQKAVDSAIKSATVKCWVFRQAPTAVGLPGK